MAYGRGELEHGTSLSEQSLACARESADHRTAVLALTSQSFTLRDRGDHLHSTPLLEQGLALARQIGYRWGEAFCLYLMNQEAGHREDLDAVGEFCSLALPLFRETGERLGLAYTLKDLSRVAYARGEYEPASRLEQESLELSRELGNRRGICFALTGLARDARRRGEYRQAGELLREVLSIWQQLGNRVHIGVTMTAIASLAAAQRQFAFAARLFGAAEALLESVGAARPRGEMKVETGYDEAIIRIRRALGEEFFAAEWIAGRTQSMDDAIDAALSVTAPRQGAAPVRDEGGLNRLSARERQVALLIAEGYSNRDIARTLVVTRRTADTHVNHILSKLGLHTRAQVAAWVVAQGGAVPGSN
jgi:non-specific serine/threonine protein kinase